MLRIDFVDRLPAKVIKPLPQTDPKWFTTDHVTYRAVYGELLICQEFREFSVSCYDAEMVRPEDALF